MKRLTLYKDYNGEQPEVVGSVTEDDVSSPLYVLFPPVWADGVELTPADGAQYLQAVHEELGRGTFTWTELDEV